MGLKPGLGDYIWVNINGVFREDWFNFAPLPWWGTVPCREGLGDGYKYEVDARKCIIQFNSFGVTVSAWKKQGNPGTWWRFFVGTSYYPSHPVPGYCANIYDTEDDGYWGGGASWWYGSKTGQAGEAFAQGQELLLPDDDKTFYELSGNTAGASLRIARKQKDWCCYIKRKIGT